MNDQWRRGGKIRVTAACVAAIIAAGKAPAQEDGVSIEEVTVTGSRIRRTDGMAEPTPVTTLTPQELSMFEPGSTVAEQLDALDHRQIVLDQPIKALGKYEVQVKLSAGVSATFKFFVVASAK
jgi:hypothetical protein